MKRPSRPSREIHESLERGDSTCRHQEHDWRPTWRSDLRQQGAVPAIRLPRGPVRWGDQSAQALAGEPREHSEKELHLIRFRQTTDQEHRQLADARARLQQRQPNSMGDTTAHGTTRHRHASSPQQCHGNREFRDREDVPGTNFHTAT